VISPSVEIFLGWRVPLRGCKSKTSHGKILIFSIVITTGRVGGLKKATKKYQTKKRANPLELALFYLNC